MPLDWECPNCERVFHTDTEIAIESFGPWDYCPSCGAPRDPDTAEIIEHMNEDMDWPEFFASGESVDDDGFVPAYYRVEGPCGPVSFMNPGSDAPYPTTMYDLVMEAQSNDFKWVSKKETPFAEVEDGDSE